MLLGQIQSNQRHLETVFTDIVSNLDNPLQNPGPEQSLAFVQISWSRMEVQNQGLVFNASLLAQKFRDQADLMNQTNLLLIIVLIGIFGTYIRLNYFMTYRHTLRSLTDL